MMKNKKIFLLLVVCSFLLPAILSSDDDWPMFRHDPQHTGYSDCEMPDELELLWKSERVGDYIFSSPAVANGKIYIGSDDKHIYYFDANTGKVIRKDKTNGFVKSSPAVANGRVYVGSFDNCLYCIDAETGELVWKYETGGYVKSSPAVANGRVYVGSFDNCLYCIDAETGELVWKYETSRSVESSPAIVDGKVYVGSGEPDGNHGFIYCLNADIGRLIWRYKTKGCVRSSPAVADGKVYVGSDDKYIYCLDANTGKIIWKYKTDAPVFSSPAVANEKLYVGSRDGCLYCFGVKSQTPTSTPPVTTAKPTTLLPTTSPPTTVPPTTTPAPLPSGSLTLNKSVFEQGESVEFSLKNKGIKPILLPNIELWKVYKIEKTDILVCISTKNEKKEVSAFKSESWLWDQKNNEGKYVSVGNYKVVFRTNNAGTFYKYFTIIKKTPFWRNYSFSIAVIILILFTSSSAVYLRKKRRSVQVYGYKEVRGIIPVLLTAPHAQSPNADLYTGEIVKKLANNTGAWGLISTISRNEIDYNRAEGRETPFRMRIDDLIRRGKIKYILDIHGMKERNLGDVELGTKMGTSASEEFISKLKETFEKEGIECTIERIGFTGGDIIEYHSDPPFVEAVQIEISRTLREHQRKKIVEILSRFIKRIVMEESDEG